MFAYDLIGPTLLWPPECFDYSYLGRKRGVWVSFDTGRECHSFLCSRSEFERKQKKRGRREREREGLREELTALRQTQRMRAALDPCGSPRCAERTHTRQLPATRGESEVLLQVWRVRSGGQPRQVGAFLFLLLLLLSSCSSCLCFGIRRSKGKAKPERISSVCLLWMILVAPPC